ncbi:MAG: hypothetical protein COT92_01270 [Candidatus Doudnabacteria bacterium CG10_big_fil_rev_8_21_14_0_10_42_18]|uniref:Uncharacterized protein n=1 Tax=Candidatus Doudnabacteria bacterium CG10_big_fil_rev_8_21_14_0_10_42_18 TaxID=1974552 RepID=A0A2H0VBF3_9BACT|nr:MAG: hypothetical protein COT92_01270 [Candidatus Doudnabacteria bacterium CG10_big_fil_rev_8_21_14_0_10_42_18]
MLSDKYKAGQAFSQGLTLKRERFKVLINKSKEQRRALLDAGGIICLNLEVVVAQGGAIP